MYIYIYAQESPGKGSALQLPGFAKDAPDGFRGDRISDAGALIGGNLDLVGWRTTVDGNH